jgi:hypothetical protein
MNPVSAQQKKFWLKDWFVPGSIIGALGLFASIIAILATQPAVLSWSLFSRSDLINKISGATEAVNIRVGEKVVNTVYSEIPFHFDGAKITFYDANWSNNT